MPQRLALARFAVLDFVQAAVGVDNVLVRFVLLAASK
jgi:hypothetical protein